MFSTVATIITEMLKASGYTVQGMDTDMVDISWPKFDKGAVLFSPEAKADNTLLKQSLIARTITFVIGRHVNKASYPAMLDIEDELDTCVATFGRYLLTKQHAGMDVRFGELSGVVAQEENNDDINWVMRFTVPVSYNTKV